mgnify:CR=1 FL=1
MTLYSNQSQIAQLQLKYGACGSVSFFQHDDLIGLDIKNQQAQARIFLQGAHLTKYELQSGQEIIWCSPDASYEKSKAIRGGIPVCWPWFGDLSKNPDQVKRSICTSDVAAHGFARNLVWQLSSIVESSQDETLVTLSLHSSDYTKTYFPYDFELEIEFLISDHLQLNWKVTNCSHDSFSYSAALHTYFSVDDVRENSVSGFSGLNYIDALDEWSVCKQAGDIYFDREVDRIYQDTPSKFCINNSSEKRSVVVESSGSKSSVVWNPWVAKSKALSDFGDLDYLKMLCVETANADRDFVTLQQGQSQIMSIKITTT